MKKFVLVALTAFLTVFLINSALAADVAYVVKSAADPFLTSELRNNGLTYDIIRESNLTSTNFSKYRMLLVGNDNFDDFTKIPAEKYNSLIINQYNSQWGWSLRRGSASSPTSIRFSLLNTTLSDGIPEVFKGYFVQNINVNTYFITGKKATGIKLIAQVSERTFHDSVLAVAYPGTKYLNGKTGEKRSLFFGIVETKYWSIDSRQLFRNSLDWVLIGEDNDADGFYSDEDCNDANAGINPDEEEVAYDEIDQDCNGYDLADVDLDSYCKEGYPIKNASLQCPRESGASGTDCDDEDSDFNPGSQKLPLNCRNDLPIISSIPNFIVRESQLVRLVIDASDPENNSLTYYVNGSKFTQTDTKTFEWQTGFFDAGNYSFVVTVSDGQLNATKNFKVEVREKNQAPELNATIPDQSWSEDTNLSLNLSEYFRDLDESDILEFGVSRTSSDRNISVESIINGIVNFIVKRDWSGFDWIIFFAYDGKDSVESNNVTLTVTPVNDAPLLTLQIADQTWNEDTKLVLDLGKYFTDVDSELDYSVTGNSQINVSFAGSTATFIPAKDWNGKETIKIEATDEEFSVSSGEIVLTVAPVNDAPVLDLIGNEIVLGGNLVDIDPTATDVDGDGLEFTFSSPLDQEGKWQTTQQDAGVYKITASVHDGKGGSDSQEFTIQVLQKFYINEFVSNPTSGNEWIELYNDFNQIINLSDCAVKDGSGDVFILNGNTTLGKNKFAVVEMSNKIDNLGDTLMLYCSDELIDTVAYGNWNDGNLGDNAGAPGLGESASRNPDGADTDSDAEDFDIFRYPTKGLPSNTDMVAPAVRLLNPQDGALFTETRDITFEFIAEDNVAGTLECEIYLDGVSKATNKNVKNNSATGILVDSTSDGEYSWNVRCYDKRNYGFAEDNRTLTISAPDNPVLAPIGQKSVDENQTLQFTISATDQDNDKVSFSIQNVPQGADFADNLGGTATFSWTPTYEQSGVYDVVFISTDSSGLTDQETVRITVNDKRIPPEFTDVDRCEVKNPLLGISIKNPDEGDEFKVGEEIDVKADIKNDHTDKLDVKLKAYLYNIDDEEAIENEKDSVDIDKGKSKDATLSLKIPGDIKDDDEYAVFVLAEGKNKVTICNEQFVYIDISREEDNITIKDLLISEEPVLPGSILDLTVEMQNTGSEDQDVHVEIRNSKLGILVKSEEFELERYGDKDEETRDFEIKIPEQATEGNYDLEIKIVSDKAQDSVLGTFYIQRKEGVLKDESVSQTQESKTESAQQDPLSVYLTFNLLVLALVAASIFVIKFARHRKLIIKFARQKR